MPSSPLLLVAMLPLSYLVGWSFGLAVELVERLRRSLVVAG